MEKQVRRKTIAQAVPWNPLEATSASGECNDGRPPLCLHFCNHNTEPWYVEAKILTFHPVSRKSCQEHGHGHLPQDSGWGDANILKAEIDQN